MKRIALVSSEPIRERMAGIGIRYLELARRLPAAAGVETVLISPAAPEESERALAAAEDGDGDGRGSAAEDGATAGETPGGEAAPGGGRGSGHAASGDAAAGPVAVRRFAAAELPRLLADCDAVVAQGQLANDVLLAGGERPVAIDLYDPWLIENLHYHAVLGLDPYRNDHATWVLQLSRGDLFLCSSEEQRSYYLGWLTALGRVNPERVAADPDLAGLVAVVPFGVPPALPAHRPWLDPPRPGERRILFGGLYDWYDPWTLLDACERLGDGVDWTVLLIANPNPGSTPQRLLGQVEADCRRRGWWGSRVRLLDWVPTARRYDLLRDVDLLAAPHRPSLETRLSLRTRFLDAAAAGLPVAVSEGGAMSRLVAEHGAGWVVPPGDAAALAAALGAALGDPDAAAARRRGAAALAAAFAWDRMLAPLAAFCRDPRADVTKESYAFRPPTAAPPDRLHFRLRRRLARLAARGKR